MWHTVSTGNLTDNIRHYFSCIISAALIVNNSGNSQFEAIVMDLGHLNNHFNGKNYLFLREEKLR